jgi:hypothetical protein
MVPNAKHSWLERPNAREEHSRRRAVSRTRGMRLTRVWGNPMERALHNLQIGLWGRGCVLCLLSKPVAEGVEAEKGHDADFTVETL